MLRYTLKRFLSMLVTLFLVATVTFFLMHAVPGQPFELTRETPDSVRQALEAKLGLDKPLIEQYFIYMRNLLRGDFGISMKYKGQSVIGEVTSGMPISAVIGFGGVLVGCIIGAVLGAVAALKNKGAVDYIVIILAILGVSVPNFVFGSLIRGMETVSDSGLENVAMRHTSHHGGRLHKHRLLRADAPLQHAGCHGAGLHLHRPQQRAF